MRPLYLFCLLLVIGNLAGCGRVQNERFTGGSGSLPAGVTISVTVAGEGVPRLGTAGEVQIEITNDGLPVSGAEMIVEGNMTHAGMEPITAHAVETMPGHYLATLDWSMAGEWFLIVRGTLPDGTLFQHAEQGLTIQS
jgi:hypothetical protein